jgi:chemotaxis protein CheX
VKAEYINPFLVATSNVFRDLLKVQLVRGRTLIKKTPAPSHEIAIFVGVKGKNPGQVIYSMNLETIYKIASRLMPGADTAELKKEWRDMIGEVANMITGNAMQMLIAGDAGLDLTVPMVVDIRKQAPEIPPMPTIGLNFYAPFGLIEANVAFKAMGG